MDAMGYRFKKMIEQDPPQKITLTRHRSSEVALFFARWAPWKQEELELDVIHVMFAKEIIQKKTASHLQQRCWCSCKVVDTGSMVCSWKAKKIFAAKNGWILWAKNPWIFEMLRCFLIFLIFLVKYLWDPTNPQFKVKSSRKISNVH